MPVIGSFAAAGHFTDVLVILFLLVISVYYPYWQDRRARRLESEGGA